MLSKGFDTGILPSLCGMSALDWTFIATTFFVHMASSDFKVGLGMRRSGGIDSFQPCLYCDHHGDKPMLSNGFDTRALLFRAFAGALIVSGFPAFLYSFHHGDMQRLSGGCCMQKLKLGAGSGIGGGISKGSGKKKRMGVHGAVLACENGEPHPSPLERHLSLYKSCGKPILPISNSKSTNDKAIVQRRIYC